MIDFKDCPKEKTWLLFDSEGNSEYIMTDTKLWYARLQIARNKLEGYYLVREEDYLTKPMDEIEKYSINHYGKVEDWPKDLFCAVELMSGEIIEAAIKTKKEEGDKLYLLEE